MPETRNTWTRRTKYERKRERESMSKLVIRCLLSQYSFSHLIVYIWFCFSVYLSTRYPHLFPDFCRHAGNYSRGVGPPLNSAFLKYSILLMPIFVEREEEEWIERIMLLNKKKKITIQTAVKNNGSRASKYIKHTSVYRILPSVLSALFVLCVCECVFDLVHLLQLFTKQHNKMSKYIGEFTYYTPYIYLFFPLLCRLGWVEHAILILLSKC